MINKNPYAISIRDLTFSWKTESSNLLEIPELLLPIGTQVFLKGESGSGKSTLLSLLAGIQLPQKGEVNIFNTPLNKLDSVARDRFRADNMGYIFQMFNLIPYLTIIENVILSCQISKKKRIAFASHEQLLKEAERLLTAIGLSAIDWYHTPVTELSIGEQQRVAACRALIGHPKIILADEPTSALDTDSQQAFIQLLITECKNHNITLLFVSHDTRLAHLFDKKVVLKNGKVLNQGNPKDFV